MLITPAKGVQAQSQMKRAEKPAQIYSLSKQLSKLLIMRGWAQIFLHQKKKTFF